MLLTHYKPLFSLAATYKLAGYNVSGEGITVVPVAQSDDKMNNLALMPVYKENTATVYYKGIQTPAALPLTSEPMLEINVPEYFYFGIDVAGKEKLKGLKLHTSAAKAKEIGYPVMYDAAITAMGGDEEMTIRDDVKVVDPLFAFTVTAAETGIAGNYLLLEVRDEHNVLKDLGLQPAKLNDKSIDGAGAVPEFTFSVDATKLEAGIYEFKAGAYSKKYFISNGMEVSNIVALIRLLKNNFLTYKKNLADKTFAQFELQIPSA